MVEVVRRHIGTGLLALLLSSAAFGTSGPFAKALIEAGWAPGAVVLVRIAGAAAVLLPVALWTSGTACARSCASCPWRGRTACSPSRPPSSATSRPSSG